MRPSRSARRQPGPVSDVGEEVTGRDHGRAGEPHVLGHHRRVVVAASRADRRPTHRRTARRDRPPGAPDGRRSKPACTPRPTREAAPARASCEDLLGPLEAGRDVLLRRRLIMVVGEAVHVRHLDAVDEHPVVAAKSLAPRLQGPGMGLRPIAGHRAGKMHGVLRPRARAREARKRARRLSLCSSWRSPIDQGPDPAPRPWNYVPSANKGKGDSR